MMAGIHLDVQLYDKVCIFLTEVWQARSAWNIPDCLILLSLRKKILKVFRACGGGSTDRLIFFWKPSIFATLTLSISLMLRPIPLSLSLSLMPDTTELINLTDVWTLSTHTNMTIENFMLCFFDQVQSLNRNEYKLILQTVKALALKTANFWKIRLQLWAQRSSLKLIQAFLPE